MNDERINIEGLSKAAVLAALYNKSRPIGMGHLHYTPEDMTKTEAEALLVDQSYFDYVNGRVIKVKLDGKTFDPWLYDRDNGKDAAACIIRNLRDTEDPS